MGEDLLRYRAMGVKMRTQKSVIFSWMIAHALNPGLQHPDGAYPYLIGHVVPLGLRGITFAVLFGAIISTVD
jgi:uncharacterized sodium:solute symporter family permease YidK